jgi:hypothetical protein
MIAKLAADGKLRVVKIGRRVLVPVDALRSLADGETCTRVLANDTATTTPATTVGDERLRVQARRGTESDPT